MPARWIWIIAMATLVSCGPRTTDDRQNSAVQKQKNQAATVANLPPGQRNGAFLRAIRDAGVPCQDIVKAEVLPQRGETAQWRVECEDHVQHLVAIAPAGPVIVTSRTGP